MHSMTTTANFQKYKQMLESVLGQEVDILSTVDHIYTSPPIRLIDSHKVLNDFPDGKVTPILWDVNVPSWEKFKAELILDSAFYSSRREEFLLFNPTFPYYEGKRLDLNINLQQERLELAASNHFGKKRGVEKELAVSRFAEIAKMALGSSEHEPAQWYKNYLKDFYNLLDQREQVQLIERYIVLSKSGIFTKFIPELIRETWNEPFGLKHLIGNTDILKPPYFRSPETSSLNYVASDITAEKLVGEIETILEKAKEMKLLPSKDIVNWALAISQVRHFGNDYGMFARLGDYLASIGIANDIKNLQLTEHKKDGTNFIDLANPFYYTEYSDDMSDKLKKINTSSSKGVNMVSVYMHLGREGFKSAIDSWFAYKEQTVLPFGQIKND